MTNVQIAFSSTETITIILKSTILAAFSHKFINMEIIISINTSILLEICFTHVSKLRAISHNYSIGKSK